MTVQLVLGVLGVALVAVLSLREAIGPATRTTRPDRRMRNTGALDRKTARKTAKRLGIQSPGLLVGRTASGRRPLIQGWEDGSLDIAGPRSGKTTCRVAPMVVQAPGAVIATSNKRDVVDMTREQRERRGPVHVFDPQGIVGEPAALWWDFSQFVQDEPRAHELAGIFSAANVRRDAREDGFFAPRGRRVVAALLLAAASSGRTLDCVYRWATSARDDEPVDLLRDAGHGLMADGLRGDLDAPERQRAGIFATAEASLGFVTSRHALQWCTPGIGRERLDVDALLDDAAALYLLSRETSGNAGALVAGVVAHVCDAAERRAIASPGGRLPVPLVCALDECTNTVRWEGLPALYSHYGSRGIVLAAFAQSWAQLREAYGEHGARTLWGAARVRVIGSGVADAELLRDVSALVGDADEHVVGTSRSRNGRATSVAVRRRPILEPAALAALGRGQALVLPAGAPPVLARLIPWWDQ